MSRIKKIIGEEKDVNGIVLGIVMHRLEFRNEQTPSDYVGEVVYVFERKGKKLFKRGKRLQKIE